jgi:Fe-S-cluster-containing dehydrogenase component
MLNIICFKYCSSPFCVASCPGGALSVSQKDGNVYVETEKCNRCGICRGMCVRLSFDKYLESRRPWVREDFGRTR